MDEISNKRAGGNIRLIGPSSIRVRAPLKSNRNRAVSIRVSHDDSTDKRTSVSP